MTANILTKDYLDYARNQREEFKNQITFISSIKNEESSELNKLIKLTSVSIKSMANAYFKTRCYLGLNDIDKIKESLKNFSSDDDKVNMFKESMVNDLSDFQEQIMMKHVATLRKMRGDKSLLEKQAKQLDAMKNKIIMERLSKIQWPYDETTKEIDNKLSVIDIKISRYTQKITEMESLPPVAEEKDLILYQVQLKEKYGAK